AEVAPPDDVTVRQTMQCVSGSRLVDEIAEQLVVCVTAVLEVRLLASVRSRGAARRRRREQLKHTQRLLAMRERVVPGVPPKENVVPCGYALDLPGLRVGERHHAAQDVQQLV